MYKRRKGLTLIEIVIYMGLLTTIMMIAGISFSYIRNKIQEVRIEEEIARVKVFLNKQLLDSSKTANGKKIYLREQEIEENKTKEIIKLIHSTIDVKNSLGTGIGINQGKFSEKNFKIKLKDKNKGVYIIEMCRSCGKIH